MLTKQLQLLGKQLLLNYLVIIEVQRARGAWLQLSAITWKKVGFVFSYTLLNMCSSSIVWHSSCHSEQNFGTEVMAKQSNRKKLWLTMQKYTENLK